MTDSSRDKDILHSSYREKLVEHLFVGELLRHLWLRNIVSVSVLRPEVDNAGYDIVLTHSHTVRHVQLKCSRHDAAAASQKINASLGDQPSGCVIWLEIDQELNFHRFLWFGEPPGKPLPNLDGFPIAKHTKPNMQGIKVPRLGIRKIPKGAFEPLADMASLIDVMFGSTLEAHA